MRYDLRIALDQSAKAKTRQARKVSRRIESLTRENLELRAEVQILKRISIYAIDQRKGTGEDEERHGNESGG